MIQWLMAGFALLNFLGCASTKTASYRYAQKQIEQGDLNFESRLRVDEYVNAFPQDDLAKPKAGEDLALQILSSTVGSEAWNSRDLKSRPH